MLSAVFYHSLMLWTAGGLFCLGIALVAVNRDQMSYSLLALYLWLASGWLLFSYGYIQYPQFSPVMVPLQMALNSWLGVVFYFFARKLVHERLPLDGAGRLLLLAGAAVSLLCLLHVLSPVLRGRLEGLVEIEGGAVRRRVDWLYLMYTALFAVSHAAGLVYLFRGWRRAEGRLSRRRIFPVFAGAAAAAGGVFGSISLFHFLGWARQGDAALVFILAGGLTAAVNLLVNREDTLAELMKQLNSHQMALQEANRKLRRQAATDSLTGLYNRMDLSSRMAQELERFRRYGGSGLSLLYIDLDNFKACNDQFGHARGDQVLADFSALMKGCIRNSDIPYRIGGDEFLIIMPETDLEAASRVGNRLIDGVAAWELGIVGCSVGAVCVDPGERVSPDSLISRADKALYQAKLSGKNQVMTGRFRAGSG